MNVRIRKKHYRWEHKEHTDNHEICLCWQCSLCLDRYLNICEQRMHYRRMEKAEQVSGNNGRRETLPWYWNPYLWQEHSSKYIWSRIVIWTPCPEKMKSAFACTVVYENRETLSGSGIDDWGIAIQSDLATLLVQPWEALYSMPPVLMSRLCIREPIGNESPYLRFLSGGKYNWIIKRG